ncbi:MAG: hypothetical protein R3A51_03520 [Nannocystaceae bacterium]|nr:hypothetical protein [Myxococcales bacterium]
MNLIKQHAARRLVRHLALGATLATTVVVSSCRGLDPTFSCTDQAEALAVELAKVGYLRDTVPTFAPYAMAMVLSEQGLNEMLTTSLGGVGDVPNFDIILNIGPGEISFVPVGTPELTLEHVAGCETCIRMYTKFDLNVLLGDMGIINGIGDFTIAVPLELKIYDNTSYLVARFDELIFEPEDFNMSVEGIDLNDIKAIKEYLQTLVFRQIRDGIGEVLVVQFDPWSIGDEKVVLAAREVFVNPEEKTLVLGIATNLDVAQGAGVETKVGLEADQKMRVTFHAELIEAMAQRMLEEGYIPRHYNENGDPDPNGLITATIDGMTTKSSAEATIDTTFRVWQTDPEQYCGYATVEMPLFLRIIDGGLGVQPGEIKVTGGEGIGKVIADNNELVEENKDVVNEFRTALAEQVGITVNYSELRLDGAVLAITTNEVSTDANGVHVDMDFDIIPSN